MSEEIHYLSQVSTSQAHEGSVYGAEKVHMQCGPLSVRVLFRGVASFVLFLDKWGHFGRGRGVHCCTHQLEGI